jgi:hypothetical protein
MEQTETTVLEVDVVRFVAVVGLTLMVVFALVHSLPYQGDAAELEEPEELKEPELQPALADPESVTIPAEDYDELVTARQHAEQELALVQQQAKELESGLDARSDELGRAHREIARLEREATASVVPSTSKPRPVAQSRNRSADTLVLRFRDDDVYLRLLETGRIQSFVIVPDLDLTYEVIPGHRDRLGLSLVYGLEAERLYRIPDVVVPPVLRQAIRSFDFRLSQRSDLVALVVLSDSINAQVDELRGAGRTGDFDILADERVVPKE